MSQEFIQTDRILVDDISTPKQEAKKKGTIVEESKQWESFFDPQYTFGSFQTGITKPSSNAYYNKEKRFLAHESSIPNSEPSSPTLPDLKQLELHINTIEHNDDTQIKILPRPFPKYNKNTEETLCKERLELLNIIQVIGFNKENDAAQSDPYQKISTTARLQLQLKNKAEQMKREILLDSEDENNSIKSNEDTDIPKDQSSLVSLDDMYEKISFRESKPSKVQEKDPEIKRKNRTSFLYFAYGFLFPPLWIIGALYVPKDHTHRSSESKSIDKKWKVYSRNALFSFIILLIAITVLIIILKPETIGFRNSSEGGYNADRVVFDEEDVKISI